MATETDAPVVDYEVQGRTAYITLNRPDKLNAISQPLRNGLYESYTKVKEDEDVWVAILSARGKHFSAGRDLVERVEQGDDLPGPSNADIYALQRSINKPLFSAIHGVCLAAGTGIALSADIRIADTSARFGWPQVKRGVSSVSGPTLLSRFVPRNVALEYMFTGDFMPAEVAERWGLVNRVVPEGTALDAAEELANKILENAPLAVRAMKEATIRTEHLRADDAYMVANFMIERVDSTEDSKEGLNAFKEKRDPVWQGR